MRSLKLNEQKRLLITRFWSDVCSLWMESAISKVYLCVSAGLFAVTLYALNHRSPAAKYMMVVDAGNWLILGFILSHRPPKQRESTLGSNH